MRVEAKGEREIACNSPNKAKNPRRRSITEELACKSSSKRKKS